MKLSTMAAASILLAASLCGWSQTSTPSRSQPSASEVAANFTNYIRVTTNVVYVNPELAMLCRGASKGQVQAARAKFGPHANTGILIYMNKLAADAFGTNANAFPVGSVVVKQKSISWYLNTDGTRVKGAETGVGGMIKRPAGYDPMHGDWEYFYFEDVRKIENGPIASCVQCHSSARDKDYVFGTWRKAGN